MVMISQDEEFSVWSSGSIIYRGTRQKCWEFVQSQLLHPRKSTRDVGKSLEVRNIAGVKDWRVPSEVKLLYGL